MVYLNNATPKWVFSVEEIHTNLLPLVHNRMPTSTSLITSEGIVKKKTSIRTE